MSEIKVKMDKKDWTDTIVALLWTSGVLMLVDTYVGALGDIVPNVETYGPWTGVVGLLFIVTLVLAPLGALIWMASTIVKHWSFQ